MNNEVLQFDTSDTKVTELSTQSKTGQIAVNPENQDDNLTDTSDNPPMTMKTTCFIKEWTIQNSENTKENKTGTNKHEKKILKLKG